MRKIATIIASLAVVGIDNAYAQSDSISLREVEVTAIAKNQVSNLLLLFNSCRQSECRLLALDLWQKP